MEHLSKGLWNRAFSHIYVEKNARAFPLTEKIITALPKSQIINIDHYKDVFCKKNQNFAAQKQSQALILAVNRDKFLYEGSRYCDSFGHEHFYYQTSVKNCPYDCEYCYLQGVYPSANVVVFVNAGEALEQVSRLLCEKPVYLCISYDTDLLAFEGMTGFVSDWLSLAEHEPNLSIEVRTKSANFGAIAHRRPNRNVVLAWSVSPAEICEQYELRCPSLHGRLADMQAAVKAGWNVRVCFDPLLFVPDWQKRYQHCVDTVFSTINPKTVYDVSLGVFRVPTRRLKTLRKLRPCSQLLAYPFAADGSYQPADKARLTGFMHERIAQYVAKERIWVYDER